MGEGLGCKRALKTPVAGHNVAAKGCIVRSEGMATGAAAGLPADRCWGEITAPLPSLAALLARVERLLILAWVVGDALSVLETGLRLARARAGPRRAASKYGTSKYQLGT